MLLSLFLCLGTQTRYFLMQVKQILVKKDRLALALSEDCRLVFTRARKRFTDSLAVANRNRVSSFSCVCCRGGYQTLEFYRGKTGQAFDFKYGMCIRELIVCVVKPRSNVPNISTNIKIGKKAKTLQCSIEGGQMHRTFHRTF